MRRSTHVSAVVIVLFFAVLAAGGGGAGGAGTTTLKSPQLQAFGSCGNLLAYAKQHALPLVGAYGLGGVVVGGVATPGTAPGAPGAARDAATPTPGVDYSTTNVQEEGVDEPDLVKSNGSTIYVVRSDRLFAVDVRTSRPRLQGSLQLPQGASYELLLHGNRLLVLSRGGLYPVDVIGGIRAPIRPGPLQSTLTEVDVSDPGAMRIVRGLSFDAEILSARLVGSVARVVTTSSMPEALPFRPPTQATPDATAAALAHNRDVVRTSRIGSWLPRYRIKGRRGETLARRLLVDCSDVRRPALYSGLGLLTVLTIDLRKGLALTDSDSIVADGRTVYASQKSLYVATQRWFAQPVNAGASDPPKVTTAIHKFDISDPESTVYRGSGTVSGYLLNQWSLSEQDGVLRVASTEEPTWWNPGPQEESESFVTTLKEQGGALVQLGRVGGLGKGERVYAVRFSGDTGYVVTFRQVDPLYTLDLSKPARPAVLGELKIQGYSAYLHPLGGDLLLGIGQDASEEGRVRGTQLSLFDVSDLRRPTRIQTYALGSAWSEAESDHHAFLWWEPSRLAVLPVQAFADKPFVGAVGFRVGRGGIVEAGRVTHAGEPSGAGGSRVAGIPVRRSAVVGDTLYTVSDQGVKATSLASFADQGWVAFPSSTATGTTPSR
jgi:Beta propeller domain